MSEPQRVAGPGDVVCALLPALANRHGLITGTTGTSKTITLQNLAEGFSRIGLPMFMIADDSGPLQIEEQGRDRFFGEPMLNIADFMQTVNGPREASWTSSSRCSSSTRGALLRAGLPGTGHRGAGGTVRSCGPADHHRFFGSPCPCADPGRDALTLLHCARPRES